MSGLGLTFLRRGGQAHPTAGSDYILSATRGDAEVFRILMANGVSSDGVGITLEDAEKVTSISTWFQGNTIIESFNELQHFKGITTLGTTAASGAPFSGCTNLREVSLPENCTAIGHSAFKGCVNLEYLDGIENATLLRTDALNGCTSLVYDELNLPLLTELQSGALYGVKIRVLRMPNMSKQITATSSSMHYGDREYLEEVYLSEALTTIFSYSFYRYSKLRKVVGSSKMIKIGRSAFGECSALVDLSIGWSSITTLETYVFDGCISLVIDELNLASLSGTQLINAVFRGTKVRRVTAIGSIQKMFASAAGDGVFRNCTELIYANLPSTLIECKAAFQGCTALQTLILNSTTPPTTSSDNLSGTNSTFIIYVPDASVDAYKAASGWSTYASRIKGISEYNG